MIYKSGQRAKVFTKMVTGEEKQDVVMAFELKKAIEVSEIRLAFVNFWSAESVEHLDVSSVIVESALSQKQSYRYLCNLEKLCDKSQEIHGVTVFGCNLLITEALSTKTDIIRRHIESLRSTKAQRLRFVIRTDVKRAISGTLAARSSNQKAIGINYCSILGYDCAIMPSIKEAMISDNRRSACQTLNLFNIKPFRASLKGLTTGSVLSSQVRADFYGLISLMGSEDTTLEPFLLAICSHNADLSQWVLQEVLRVSHQVGSVCFLTHLCLSNMNRVGDSQSVLLSCILSVMDTLAPGPDCNPTKTSTLCCYIRQYISLLYILSPLLGKPISLQITEKDLCLVVKRIVSFWDIEEVRTSLIKLFLVLAMPPQGIITKVNMQDFAHKHLLFPVHSIYLYVYLYLASLLALFESEVAQSVILCIPRDIHLQGQEADTVLRTLLCLTRDDDIRERILDSSLSLVIYNAWKEAANIASKQGESLLLLTEQLLVRCLMHNTARAKDILQALIQDIDTMHQSTPHKLVPMRLLSIFQTQPTVPICFYTYESESEQRNLITSDTTYMSANKKTSFLDTTLLSDNHKSYLFQTLHKHTCSAPESKAILTADWTLAFKEEGTPPPNSAECFRHFLESISGKGPFVIFMSGMSEGKHTIAGVFSLSLFPCIPTDWQPNQQMDIVSSEQTLFFYYTEDTTNHFVMNNKEEKIGFLVLDYANAGACVVGDSFLSFSYTASYPNSIGNIGSLQCIDGNITYLPYSFLLDTIEIWTSHSLPHHIPIGYTDIVSPLTCLPVHQHSWYNKVSGSEPYRPNAVFEVPALVTVKELIECVIGRSEVKVRLHGNRKLLKGDVVLGKLYKEMQTILNCGIIDIELEFGKDTQNITLSTTYTRDTHLILLFEALGGYRALVHTATLWVSQWKQRILGDIIYTYLKDLALFGLLPGFSQSLLTNWSITHFLLSLFSHYPQHSDSETGRIPRLLPETNWAMRCQEALVQSYLILSQLYTKSDSIELRQQTIQSGILSSLLHRFDSISHHSPRHWEAEVPRRECDSPKGSKTARRIEVKRVSDISVKAETGTVVPSMESKETQTKQLVALVDLLKNFLNTDKWSPDPTFVKALCESSLLPFIESTLSSSSLLAMAKDSDLVLASLDLLTQFSKNTALATLLIELDPHYLPPQHQPLYKVVEKLAELGGVYLGCMEKQKTQTVDNVIPQRLAEKARDCNEQIVKSLRLATKRELEQEHKKILSLSLPEVYRELLAGLKFGYGRLRESQDHAFSVQIEKEKTLTTSKLTRLAQELADLSKGLPEEHTNAIFMRVDEERIDTQRIIVMGVTGTPYAHGVFEYDIYCPANYPHDPPRIHFYTTGHHTVRFNPNLYHDGKVCLSLLGTWTGTNTERWDPATSTILQVVLSLQSIIMTEDIYFNEPGCHVDTASTEGRRKNEGYCNIVRLCNIQYAMIEPLRNPPYPFEQVIRRHFYAKKEAIMKEVHLWIEYASTREASYEGLVKDHNPALSAILTKSKSAYKELLTKAVNELEAVLFSIDLTQELGSALSHNEAIAMQNPRASLAFTGGISLEGVDVAEDTPAESAAHVAAYAGKFGLEDPGVQDRWSRYIGALGLDAVSKQATSSVFISGAGPLGIEISKNILLSGCKQLLLHDTKPTTSLDLSGQFFLSPADIPTVPPF